MFSPSPSSSTSTRSARPDAHLHREMTSLLPELRRHACRLARSETLAEDLVQDTVERAIRFADHYERGTNLRAWMHQILFRVFITRCRRQRRERNAMRVLTTDPCAWTVPDVVRSPEKEAPLLAPLRSKLDALPTSFRDVLELVDLGHHTYREASVELGVPLGTVMSRLHRGRKMLASQVKEAA